ncbi:DUF4129 domain-containing protein [Nocardioides mangrovicus]|uniref:DUF4129 domain-containing protein n=1 Tax=Nocardioides mangrovicus TaxID=2478913 RepID=A0A3L8P5F5_9ACTN|nr:DUF4129 domain-containing protein [Nocardioides mangrovicus]RLV50626.1 DUF4129 domain-containing protein [Nocardioides mangrovicus]
MSTPLLPGPDRAEEWLRRELDRSEYHASLTQRLADWLRGLLDRAGQGPGRLSDLGLPALLLLSVVLVAVLAFVLSRLRRNPAAEPGQRTVFDEGRRSAQQHRALAQAAYAAGDFDTAVVEGVRALTAGLVERGLVADLPAATAYEVVALARPRFPDLAERLGAAALAFDETRYGARPARRERAGEVLDLEATLAAATPATSASAGEPVVAVPR